MPTVEALLARLDAIKDDAKLINQKSAADYLGYSYGHLRRILGRPPKDNVLGYVKMSDGRIYFAVADLKRFLKKRRDLHGY